ncbi:MAG TPA: hypothetical protein PK963_04230 [Arachnia sp.]|nr:hypothetical protein [Arachnia sp.]
MDRWHVEPPEPGPSRPMKLGITVLALAVAVSLVGVTYTVVTGVVPAVEAGPGGPQAPLAGPGEWSLPELDWAALPSPDPASPWAAAQRTPLDEVPSVTLRGCPPPATTLTEEAWRGAVTAQWDCVHAAWEPVLRGLGWPTTRPAVEFFTGEGSGSGCGYLEAPAFYCSADDGVVHFGEGHLRMAESWDLAVNEMVNHEYGHHLQHLAGITDVKLSLPPDGELERRSELQAICWSAMMTAHNDAVTLNEVTYSSWVGRLDTMLVDGVHGSRESIQHWGLRGLYAATAGDCNAWVAPPEAVA